MSHRPTVLPASVYSSVVDAALAEDLGAAGDITTAATIDPAATATADIVARKPGVVAGAAVAAEVFRRVGPSLAVDIVIPDGTKVTAADTVITVSGNAASILTAERVALNFLGHLSGVASETAKLVDAVAHTKARICCTRKTTPGLRALEKYAVRAGGGFNHRFGLHDGILIKDNHIVAAGGIAEAVAKARAAAGHMVRIEVEVDRVEQIEPALAAGAEAFLLDNMSPENLAKSVGLIAGRAITEASGTITLDTVAAVAESGVDYVSAGWITHSAPCLDLGLDFRD